MAIHYNGDLGALVRGLERQGHKISDMRRAAGPAGGIDLYAANGCIVRVDPFTRRVWTTGPIRAVRQTERALRKAERVPWMTQLRRFFESSATAEPTAKTLQPDAVSRA